MTPSAGALGYHDVPDIVMVLLLIAMDLSSSNDLKRDVMTAMDTICQSIKDSGAASATVRCSASYTVLMLTVLLSGTGVVQKNASIWDPAHTDQPSPFHFVLVRWLRSDVKNRQVACAQAPCWYWHAINGALRSAPISDVC
jgi:hypothetical protein